MKAYPSITTKIDFSKRYTVFDKLDGSNICAEWSPKQGFYKFGSRTQLLTTEQVLLYPSIDKIKEGFEEELNNRFRKAKFERAVCFFEYYGPNSRFGSHTDPVEKMKATLIDIAVYKKEMMIPEKFIAFSEGLNIPTVIMTGRLSEEFFQDVRHSRIKEITEEGVVGKSVDAVNKEGGSIMFKIKTNKWLDMLKMVCGNDEALYNRMK